MRTIVVTGSASGMGAATWQRLTDDGHRVIGVDVRDADVVADLGTPEGRRQAIDQVRELSGGAIDGLATFAGIGGLPGRSGALLVSINYFGSVELAEGLRELLAAGTDPAAVVISSNSTTTVPSIDERLIEACLDGDEERARDLGEEIGSMASYPTCKTALVRWMRRQAVGKEWIGSGITLNAIAPGAVETALTAESRADPVKGPLFDKFPLPIGRMGRAEELAALVAFLLGPEARFFCGSFIVCDGGTDALLRSDDWPSPATKPFL